MNAVLDSSAVLALVFGEPGASIVAASLDGAVISAVNESEVLAAMIRRGATPVQATATLEALELTALALDSRLAARAALLQAATHRAGLSLGDRCCLALADALRLPAITADRAWTGIASAIGAEVRLIR